MRIFINPPAGDAAAAPCTNIRSPSGITPWRRMRLSESALAPAWQKTSSLRLSELQPVLGVPGMPLPAQPCGHASFL